MKIFHHINIIIITFLVFRGHSLQAAYYDILPKGVRNLTYRFIQTGNITGSYGSSGDFKGYNISANLNAETIRGVSSAVDAYLDNLKATSPADYARISFGSFQGSASSKVSAQGFGGAYGITDHLTVYGFIPYYSAVVDLQIERTAKGRNNVGTTISLENLPDVDVRLIQSLFVNYYQYRPLGKWKATAFGDAELGLMYQVKKWRNACSLISMGVVAPTGKKDNPAILQDIAFGDGQWDVFYEFGGGYNLSTDWSIDSWSRITYQSPYSATVRLPDSSIFPVTSQKGNAKIKLGNKFSANLQANYKFSDEWMSSLIYGAEYVERSQFTSKSLIADAILESDTEKISHIARLNLSYSTLSLYQQKKFIAPISFNLAFQSIFAGKNIPKYERGDFEIRFFF